MALSTRTRSVGERPGKPALPRITGGDSGGLG